MRAIRVLTGLLAGAVLLSCGGDGGGGNTDIPIPGNLTVTLDPSATPGAGAVMLTITGGANKIDTVAASAGYTAYPRRLSTGSFKVVLVGPMASGSLATVHVPDTRKSALYTVTVTAVANNTTFVPMIASQYPITLVSP